MMKSFNRNHLHIMKKALLFAILILIFLASFTRSNVSASSDDTNLWQIGWQYKNNSLFSVDQSQKHGSCDYSIKIDNTDFNDAYVEKKFKVERNTYYKVSVWVKYSDYVFNSKDSGKSSGAVLQVVSEDNTVNVTSSFSYEKDWQKLELGFNTGNIDNYSIRLRNGFNAGTCKGTAWFSDFRLEKCDYYTNQWNVLTLIFKNVDAEAMIDGKMTKYQDSLNEDDVDYLSGIVKLLETDLPIMSNGLVGIRNIDIYTVDTPVKVLLPEKNNVDYASEPVRSVIESYLNTQDYNQIIIISPVQKVNIGWLGLGGTEFNGIDICQLNYSSETISYDIINNNGRTFPDSGFIHEILHGVERDSQAIDKSTPRLHSNEDIYASYYDGHEDEWYDYLSDYMNHTLPDGKGVLSEVFWRPSVYNLVSTDLTSNINNTGNYNIPNNIADKVKDLKISDSYYTGKSVKPSVNLGTLKSGTDYNISYDNNNSPGIGKIIITGKGNYTGSCELYFRISLKKTTAKIKSDSLSWKKVKGADGYDIYYSKGGKKYTLLESTKSLKFSLNNLPKGKYKIKIRAFSRTNNGIYYSDWSKVISYNKKKNTADKENLGKFGKTVASGKINSSINWKLDKNGMFVLEGKGEMPDYEKNEDRPYNSIVSNIKTIVIDDAITKIGDRSFISCPFEKIDLGNGISRIGSSAFAYCNKCKIMNLPASLKSIGIYTFMRMDSLEKFVVDGKSIYFTTKDGVLFDKRQRILINYPLGKKATTYTVQPGVITIGQCSFAGANNLEKIEILDSVSVIKGYAFCDLDNLKEIVLPSSLKKIDGPQVFSGLGKKTTTNLIFNCTSPKISYDDIFKDSILTITISKGSWNKELMQKYGGNIKWKEK